MMRFRVLYKMPGAAKPVTEDHIMSDLKDLMQYLSRDGVTKDTVEYIYVHYTPQGSNETVECVAVENKKRPSNVIPISAVKHISKGASKKDKPRIKAKDVASLGLVQHGLYSAMRGG